MHLETYVSHSSFQLNSVAHRQRLHKLLYAPYQMQTDILKLMEISTMEFKKYFPLETNFSEIQNITVFIQRNVFENAVCKIQPFCRSLIVSKIGRSVKKLYDRVPAEYFHVIFARWRCCIILFLFNTFSLKVQVSTNRSIAVFVPSQYLKQCWLTSVGQWGTVQWNPNQKSNIQLMECIWKCMLQHVNYFLSAQ